MKVNYKFLLLYLIACVSSLSMFAQKVSNITAEQIGQSIKISYELETNSTCIISLYYTNDSLEVWQGPLQKVTGDIGGGVSSGLNEIKWNVTDELSKLCGYDIKFKIEAVDEYNEMPPITEETSNNSLAANASDKVFTYIEQMPQFPGGESAMYQFIRMNMRYPQKAIDANISGKVFVNVVIDENGYVADVKVLRGIGGGCDEEVIRVIKAMPRWTPGKESGQNVRVSFNIPPISFTPRN